MDLFLHIMHTWTREVVTDTKQDESPPEGRRWIDERSWKMSLAWPLGVSGGGNFPFQALWNAHATNPESVNKLRLSASQTRKAICGKEDGWPGGAVPPVLAIAGLSSISTTNSCSLKPGQVRR